MDINRIKSVFEKFEAISDDFELKILVSGHINKTYQIRNKQKEFILQQVNTSVFKHLKIINRNILKISEHLKKKKYPHLLPELLPFQNGDYLVENQWRLFAFIPNSQTFEKVNSAKQAFEAAKFLSEFHLYLNDLNPDEIQDSILGFLDFNLRVNQFEDALNLASTERLEESEKEIQFIKNHRFLLNEWHELVSKIPLKILHADPKISNFLFSKTNENKIMALVDWDTFMKGNRLYDFGDMVRSYTNLRKEDDPETGNNFSYENYEALKNGFLFCLENELTNEEKLRLELSGKIVIYIQAMRFLTDYLNQDVYYTIRYPEQNLNRTKNQVNLLKEFVKKSP